MSHSAGFCAAVVLVATAICARQPEQTFSLPGAVLLFGDYNELRVVTPEGTQIVVPPIDVGANRGYFAYPDLARRGGAIAWGFATAWRAERTRDRARFALGLYTLTDRKWTTHGDLDDIGDVAFSPDGSRVAFVARERGTQGLLIFDVATGNFRQGPYKRGMQNHSHPSWSPDGTRIAADVHEPDKAPVVVVLDLKTDDVLVLAQGSNPRWSPNGEWIAYYTTDDRCLLIRPDGTGLTEAAKLEPSREFIIGSPVWSPDGTELLLNVSKDDRRLLDVVLLDLPSRRMTTKSASGLPVFGWAPHPARSGE